MDLVCDRSSFYWQCTGPPAAAFHILHLLGAPGILLLFKHNLSCVQLHIQPINGMLKQAISTKLFHKLNVKCNNTWSLCAIKVLIPDCCSASRKILLLKILSTAMERDCKRQTSFENSCRFFVLLNGWSSAFSDLPFYLCSSHILCVLS